MTACRQKCLWQSSKLKAPTRSVGLFLYTRHATASHVFSIHWIATLRFAHPAGIAKLARNDVSGE